MPEPYDARSAFPNPHAQQETGLSKLEWYASIAMFALMQHGAPETPDRLAREAFMLGLAMLKQSKREPLDFAPT